MKPSKLLASSYVALLIVAVAGSITLFVKGASFRTDIFSLLPPIHRDPVLEHVVHAQAESLAKKIIILVQGPTDQATEQEASRVATSMTSSGLFASVQGRVSTKDLAPLTEFFLKYPFQLAAAGLPTSTLASAESLIEGARQRAFAPDSLQWLQYAERDPLLLLPTYLKALTSNGGRYILRNGFIHLDTPSARNVLITAELRESPYARTTQARLITFLDSLTAASAVRLIPSGIVLFANDSAQRTEREVTAISTLTLCALVGVLILVFRSLSVVLAIAACIITSFLASLWGTSLIVESLHGHPLHLITLGFGSSLLGVAIDYALHFFIAHRTTPSNETQSPLSRIRAGLILGFATTAIGFMGIAVSPFPGLQELAIFCVLGLILTLLTVGLLFPAIAGAPKTDPKLRKLADISKVLLRPKVLYLATFALVALCAFGLPRLTISDDIRTLHKPSASLLNVQREVAELTGMRDGGTVVVIRAAAEDEALQIEEEIKARLGALITLGKLESYRAISDLVPSHRTQKATYQTLATTIGTAQGSFAQLAHDLHLSQRAEDTLISINSAGPEQFALPSECIANHACRTVEDLWLGSHVGQVATTIALNGFRGDPQALKAGFSGSVEIVNHADAISHALHLYRSSASVTAGTFYCAVILLLAFRYGIAKVWRVITPPLLGAIGALATLGLMGIPINVFSMFALMALLGVSVDYVIFFAEEKHPEGATHLSVFLSALTTIVSFGALSWSSTSALQSFGIVLSVGVFFAALLAPLASHRAPRS